MSSRFGVVLTLSAMLCAAVPRMAAAFENGRELAEACRSLDSGQLHERRHIRIPNTKAALLCWGYMQAVQDAVVVTDESGGRIIGACPPDKATTLDLVDAFLAYTRSQSAMLDGNAFLAVAAALQTKFPCGPERARLKE